MSTPLSETARRPTGWSARAGGQPRPRDPPAARCVSCGGCSAGDLDRDPRPDPAAGVDDRTGPSGGVSPGRPGRPHGRRRGGRLRVGWATIMGCVREYGTPLVDDPARLTGVRTLCVDETAFLAATRSPAPCSRPGSSPSTAGQGCSTLSRAEAEPCCPVGYPAATPTGGPASGWPRRTPSAAMPPRCAPPCRTQPGCWTPSTSCGSASTPVDQVRRRVQHDTSATAVARPIRCS